MRILFTLLLALLTVSACGTLDKEPKSTAKQKRPVAATAAPVEAASRADSLRTFTWQDESCENTGAYRMGTYTEKQLRDTYLLVNFPDMLSSSTTVFNLKDYTKAHFDQAGRDLKLEYDSLARSLQQAEVVPTAFWRKIKQLRLRELEEIYRLDKIALDGYYTPSSLLHNQYSADCQEYAEALASSDTTLVFKTWRKLIDEQKRNNGYPDMLEERFAQESASPDRMSYAKIQLMAFGWYNCANGRLKYHDLYDRYQLRKNYHQLFKTVKSACEDVD